MTGLLSAAQASQSLLQSRLVFALAVFGPLSACGPGTLEVGSRYVHAEMIFADEGGGFVVTATESPELAGLGIEVAPGALAEDTLVTVEPFADLQTSEGVLRVGPAVRFGPAEARFTAGVSIHLRTNESLDGYAPVVRFETATDVQDVRTGISIGGKRITVMTSRFGQFQPGRTEAPVPGFCQSDADCSPLESCDIPNNQCLPAPGCRNDDECTNGEICDDGSSQCRAGCRMDTECSAGNICDASTTTCRVGCRGDAACSPGEICNDTNSVCEAGCRNDAQCLAGQICEVASLMCRTGCRSDADCTNGETCNPALAVCEPPPPPPTRCRSDADCSNGEVCNLGTNFCE